MRGINFVQIPTSLLAMVDSSIGGKTGINNQYGKNQIGTFYNPIAIHIDNNFLKTLPRVEFINGMAEVIKTAIVGSVDLWKLVQGYSIDSLLNNDDALKNIIKITALTKYLIVSKDFEDKNKIRECLNFGHTIGHAIEYITKNKHGFCVAIGMVREILIKNSEGKYITPIFLQQQIISLLKNYELPTELNKNINYEKIKEYIKHDKKNNRIVTIDNINSPLIFKTNDQLIEEIIFDEIKLTKKNNNKKLIKFVVPSSKSETNRVLLISALSNQKITVKNCLISEDSILMLNSLNILGVKIEILKITNKSFDLYIEGCNGIFPNKNCNLFLGNSGTCCRFLIPCLSFQPGDINYKIDCDNRMKVRPMTDIFKFLENNGVNINYLNKKLQLPIVLNKGITNLKNEIEFNSKESSQFITGIIIALNSIKKNSEYKIKIGKEQVSINFIRLTIDILNKFGYNLIYDEDNREIIIEKIENQNNFCNNEYTILPDTTSALYSIAYSILNKINIFIPNLNSKSTQGDIKFCINLLIKSGVEITEINEGLLIEGNKNKIIRFPNKINMDSSDTFLTIAVLASFSKW